MDCSGTGNQYHAESDGANKKISNSGAVVGIGGKNEETADQSPPGPEMTNVKAQMSNQIQNLNDPKERILKVGHLKFIWHLPACAKPLRRRQGF